MPTPTFALSLGRHLHKTHTLLSSLDTASDSKAPRGSDSETPSQEEGPYSPSFATWGGHSKRCTQKTPGNLYPHIPLPEDLKDQLATLVWHEQEGPPHQLERFVVAWRCSLFHRLQEIIILTPKIIVLWFLTRKQVPINKSEKWRLMILKSW